MDNVFSHASEISHKNNFDLIRLLAALQVVATHTISEPLSLPLEPSALSFLLAQFPGVSIFFVVSGFLVTHSYRNSRDLVSYFARRALRIYPALWVNITLIVVLLAVSDSLSAQMGGAKLVKWFAVTFVMGSEIAGNFFVGTISKADGFYPYFPSGVTWTLVVELGFYIALPLMLLGRLNDKRYAWISLAAWGITSLLILHFYLHLKAARPDAALTKILSINLLTYLWQFLIGTACSIYWDRLRVFFKGCFLHWLVAFLCAVLLIHFYFQVDDFQNSSNAELVAVMTFLLAGVVLSFAFTWVNAASILRGNDLSYGIYLYHRPIIVTLGLLGFAGMTIDWVIVFAGTIMLAGLSWYCLERHALHLKAHADRWLVAGSRTANLPLAR